MQAPQPPQMAQQVHAGGEKREWPSPVGVDRAQSTSQQMAPVHAGAKERQWPSPVGGDRGQGGSSGPLVYSVALIGGPCGGKTSALSVLRRKL